MPCCHVEVRGEKPPDPSLPEELKTLGDHLRARRIERGLKQREVAAMIGVTDNTIWLWEGNRVQPRTKFVPRILDFLGYCPVEPGESWLARLRRARVAMGWSQEGLAAEIGVDESTVQSWEAGRQGQIRASRKKLAACVRAIVGGG